VHTLGGDYPVADVIASANVAAGVNAETAFNYALTRVNIVAITMRMELVGGKLRYLV